ncbi:MAG TPA: M12 family metallo-peptidase [Kofleriaceae bacterium]|nr:M12 family metallo-peptidase [Kofleriaceae bacterium]
MRRTVLAALAAALTAACGAESEPPPPSAGGVDAGALPEEPDADTGPACDGEVTETIPALPERRVIAIYLRAVDTQPDLALAHAEAVDRALRGMQAWYGEAMGDGYQQMTFRFDDTTVIESDYTAAEWQDFGENGFLYPDDTRSDGCGIYHAARYELNDLGKLEARGLAPVGASSNLYFVLGGGGTLGSCGGGGLATTELETLVGVAAGTPGENPIGANLVERCPSGRADSCSTDCSAAGVIAHEIGHGFGLPHTDDRPAEDGCAGGSHLMQDWWNYGTSAGLCEAERADLAASGFFAAP